VWLISRYSHYFKDSEVDVFKSAMSSIAQNTDPTDGSYSFIINCNPTNGVAKDCKRGKKS